MPDLSTPAASPMAGPGAAARRTSGDSPDIRYTDRQVVFQHAFTLGRSADTFPPGEYVVEIGEALHDRGGQSARVRASTMLIVPTAAGTRAVPVDGRDLDAALALDAQRQQLGPSENPDSGNAEYQVAEGPEEDTLEAQLERHGIERVPADIFVWEGYRYSNASDAVAAAVRGNKA
jgi:hypothetical protein